MVQVKRWIRRGLVAGVFLSTVSFPLWSGALSGQEDRQAAEGEPDVEAVMQAYTRAAQPGQNHKLLEPIVGEWDAIAQFSMPGGEEITSKGKAVSEMVLGGRFVRQTYSGEMMGQPFKGISYTGFDTVNEKYQGIWMDEMSTGIFVSEGEASEDGRTFTFTGEGPDPLSGRNKPFKHVIVVDSNDKHFFDMYETGPAGEMVKLGRITYERTK